MISGGILNGLHIVEGSAFVAAPLGGMTLAQLGADVIRFDALGGGLDGHRWPLDRRGNSLFWAGLNKGKRSIEVDLKAPEGRDIVTRLITRPGADAGIFLTNLPGAGWLSYEAFKAKRDDMIMVALSGNRDGGSAVDYTVNPATGYADVTGPRGSHTPVNSVLPAWDIAAGLHAAVGLLAAERHRTRSGQGSHVRLALSDVAFAVTAGLGRLAQGELGLDDGGKDGNFLYGAFGRDFTTGDGRRVMVVALTPKQWAALKDATGLRDAVAALAARTGLDLDAEGDRYAARDDLAAIIRPWFAARSLAEVEATFAGTGVSWGPYQTFRQLATEDPRVVADSPMFATVTHPGGAAYRTPASPLDFSAVARLPPLPAPVLGQHTDEILADVLGLPDHEIGRLRDKRIVAGP